MSIRTSQLAFVFAMLASNLLAETVSGVILIKQKLTRHSVTPSLSAFQRGPAVPLGKDLEADPIAFELLQVVVYVEGPGSPTPAVGSPVNSMAQVGRRFSPDLLVVPVGSTVSFPNGDPIFHNVFSLSKPKAFDLGNYPKGASRSVAFTKPGIVYVNCHLHPNMAAAIVVTPNQWFAQSDRTGTFALRDVPPGEYTVVAWHRAVGFFRKQVRVVQGVDARVEFFLPMDDLAVKSREIP
jgi:plastocyanin